MKNLLLILALFVVGCSSPTYIYLECNQESVQQLERTGLKMEEHNLLEKVNIRIDDKNKKIRFGLFDEVSYDTDNEWRIDAFFDNKREPSPLGLDVNYYFYLYLADFSLEIFKEKIINDEESELIIAGFYQCAVTN